MSVRPNYPIIFKRVFRFGVVFSDSILAHDILLVEVIKEIPQFGLPVNSTEKLKYDDTDFHISQEG